MHGKEASEGRCGTPSDERADTVRRADGPVPAGARGGRRIAVLPSLERRGAEPSFGRAPSAARPALSARPYPIYG